MKKLLYAGIVALSLIGVAFADDFGNDDYLSDVSSTYFNPGFYLGGQVGVTNLHYSGSDYTKSPKGSKYDDKLKFAFRAYVGYAFSQFISAELGYDYYGHPKFISNDGNTQEILQQGVDLVAKASLPLDYGFTLYMKGGIAWIYRSALSSNSGSFADKSSDSNFSPIIAVGVNYWFAPNMALDLGWTKTMGISDLPTVDLFTLGLVYNINI